MQHASWAFEHPEPRRANPLKREGNRKKYILNKNSVSPGHVIGGVYHEAPPEPKEDPKSPEVLTLRHRLREKEREIEQLRRRLGHFSPQHSRALPPPARLTPEPSKSQLEKHAVFFTKQAPKVHLFNPITGVVRADGVRDISRGRSQLSRYGQFLF